MIIKTVRRGYRICEVATHEYVRSNGESNFRVLDIWPQYVKSWLYYLFIWRPPICPPPSAQQKGSAAAKKRGTEAESPPGASKVSGAGGRFLACGDARLRALADRPNIESRTQVNVPLQ